MRNKGAIQKLLEDQREVKCSLTFAYFYLYFPAVPFLEWLRLVYKVALNIEYTAEIIANIVQLFKVDYTTTILNDLQDEILQSKNVCTNLYAVMPMLLVYMYVRKCV